MNLFHDPGFLGFMTALVGVLRWFLQVRYSHSKEVEQIKLANIQKLEATINKIEPLVQNHEAALEAFTMTMMKVNENIKSLVTRVHNAETDIGRLKNGFYKKKVEHINSN